MKKIFLFMLATGIALYACKKDSAEDNTTPIQEIDTNNPNEMTAAIKVFYGTNVQGTMPASNGAGTPALSASSNNRTIVAARGGYAVIRPSVAAGSIAGYYLKVNGADSYFKVDYSKPRTGRQAAAFGKHPLLRGTGENADSTIVIQLPENATLDTFCIEYTAYDSQNQVSNVIKICIAVVASVKDAHAQLVGNWKLTRIKNENVDSLWHDYYKPDSSFWQVKCMNDTLAQCYQEDNCFSLLSMISKYDKATINFSDSTYIEEYQDTYTFLTLDNTPCNNPTYVSDTYTSRDSGRWFYDATAQTLTTIAGYTGDPNDQPSITPVLELTDNKLVIGWPGSSIKEYIKQ